MAVVGSVNDIVHHSLVQSLKTHVNGNLDLQQYFEMTIATKWTTKGYKFVERRLEVLWTSSYNPLSHNPLKPYVNGGLSMFQNGGCRKMNREWQTTITGSMNCDWRLDERHRTTLFLEKLKYAYQIFFFTNVCSLVKNLLLFNKKIQKY